MASFVTDEKFIEAMSEYAKELANERHERKLESFLSSYKTQDLYLRHCKPNPLLPPDYHQESFGTYYGNLATDFKLKGLKHFFPVARQYFPTARVFVKEGGKVAWGLIKASLFKKHPSLASPEAGPTLDAPPPEILDQVKQIINRYGTDEEIGNITGSDLLHHISKAGAEIMYFESLGGEIARHQKELERYKGANFGKSITHNFYKSIRSIPYFSDEQNLIDSASIKNYSEHYFPHYHGTLICPKHCGQAFSDDFLRSCLEEENKSYSKLFSQFPRTKHFREGSIPMNKLIRTIYENRPKAHFSDLPLVLESPEDFDPRFPVGVPNPFYHLFDKPD